MRRLARFNAVSAGGFLVQMTAMWLLAGLLQLHYLGAAAVAIQLAILHNYAWHVRWTWRDQPATSTALVRLVRYNVLTGATALGNLGMVAVLVEGWSVPLLPASALAVGVCGAVNFTLADAAVFRAPASSGRTFAVRCRPRVAVRGTSAPFRPRPKLAALLHAISFRLEARWASLAAAWHTGS